MLLDPRPVEVEGLVLAPPNVRASPLRVSQPWRPKQSPPGLHVLRARFPVTFSPPGAPPSPENPQIGYKMTIDRRTGAETQTTLSIPDQRAGSWNLKSRDGPPLKLADAVGEIDDCVR